MHVREKEEGGKGAFIMSAPVELLAQSGGIVGMECICGRGRSSKGVERELKFGTVHDDLTSTGLEVIQDASSANLSKLPNRVTRNTRKVFMSIARRWLGSNVQSRENPAMECQWVIRVTWILRIPAQ